MSLATDIKTQMTVWSNRHQVLLRLEEVAFAAQKQAAADYADAVIHNMFGDAVTAADAIVIELGVALALKHVRLMVGLRMSAEDERWAMELERTAMNEMKRRNQAARTVYQKKHSDTTFDNEFPYR